MLQGRASCLSAWRKHHFVLNLSCWGKCHQGRSQLAPGQHHALAGGRRGSGGRGEVGDFCSPHRNTVQRVAPLRVLVSSPQYLPSPLFPSVTVCTLIYMADKLAELVWDFFPFVGGKTPPVEETVPLLHLSVISKQAVWIKIIFLS